MLKNLGCFLIFFNDPFYALNIFIPNFFSNIFSNISQITLVILILKFWISIYERINLENK